MNLPIDSILPDLQNSLRKTPNVVLEAPPGAGKTTRVPLALLDEPWLNGQKILMLEPRRLAARAAARFMASSLGEKVGETVGYRVRLDSQVTSKTRIEVVTEGVLSRLLQADPSLEGVGIVIFDEFHERSLQADLGLALCLESQAALREDLRLLVMSATLDGEAVAKLLNNAPVIASKGRSYPVELRHLPSSGRNDRFGLVHDVTAAIAQAMEVEQGSLLVFLPGMGEIKRVEEQLYERGMNAQAIIAPLYGNLSPQEQDIAISPTPSGQRKIVLATNIAETSLTIDGIRVVIDSGLTRSAFFDPGSGMTGLKTATVSQASADQRSGRAGRLEPGVCYRLWHQNQQLLPFALPEIMEADLAPLALELAQWGCHDPATLSWLDSPPVAAYAQARELLEELGGLNNDGSIAEHGKAMAALSMHPRLAHMILKGKSLGIGALACDIAALLSETDITRGSVENDTDIQSRLLVLHGGSSSKANRGAVQRVKQAVTQWRRQLKIPEQKNTMNHNMTGLLLAFAYPDRIAKRRSGAEDRFLLANGRGAFFRQSEPLACAEYLVAANLDGREREARIFLAAEVFKDELLEHFEDQIESIDFVRWDNREEAVLSRRQVRLGALVLEDKPLKDADSQLVVEALLAGIREMGLDALPWNQTNRNWQARAQFLHRLLPDEWPDVSDKTLTATLETWLASFLQGMNRRDHLRKLDLKNILTGLLSWEKQRELEELVPTHITVPSGSHIALDYFHATPVLPVRLQEMFGAVDTPRIAGGRVAVLLHLLSPARRPVQVTQDLAGFWNSSYHAVKKDLKGRYPKHFWPDDPLQAEATARAKPRKR